MPTATTPNVFELALALPPMERAKLAEVLIDNLRSTDPAADRALLEECERRWAAYKAGEVEAIPWEDALSRIDGDQDNP